MKDFTQIKLINSLIDLVERFYDKKDSLTPKESYHLKGFCEGLSFALMQQNILSQEEVERILKGFGNKISFEEIEESVSTTHAEEKIPESKPVEKEDRKHRDDIRNLLKREIEELERKRDVKEMEEEEGGHVEIELEKEIEELNKSFQHQIIMNKPKSYENLDIPSFKRRGTKKL